MTGSIRAFVANQVNVAISRFLGLKCASNILRFDSNVPPQMCLLKCASSMCLLNVPPQCRSFIIVHGSHSDDLHSIFCQEISIVANTRFGGQFWRNLVGGGTKTFHWTGRKCSKFIQFDINTLLHIQGGFFTGTPPKSSKCQSVCKQNFKIHW